MNLRDKLKFWIALNNYVEMIVGPAVAPLSLDKAVADSLSYVKAFGGTEQRNLPTEYTQLEYIQTDSNSWIDTNVVPTATTLRIDYKMQLLEQAYISFFGSVASTTPRNGLRIYYQPASSSTLWSVQSGSGVINQAIMWDSVLQGSVVATQYDSIVSTVNGNTATTSGGGINLTNPDSILIGTTHLGSNTSGIAPVKIWSFTITKDGNVVFNGIPAKNSSNVVGMYDLVSGTFFTNAGTGNLTAGDPAVPTPDAPMDIVSNNGVLKVRHQSGLPLGYTAVEYIQSSGSQYIDTGRVPNNNDIVEQKFQKVGTSTATCSWYGSVPSSQTTMPRFGIGSYWVNQVFSIFTGVNYTALIGPADTNAHTLRFQASEERKLSYIFDGISGEISVGSDLYTPAVELTSYLFARHGTDGVQAYDNEGTKIYYHREYLADGTLVLNMIPARDSNNVLGMYDTVSGQFFTNQGTGDFVAGDPVSDPVEVYADGTVETISVHSKNLFDIATATTLYRNGTVQETKTATGYTLTNSNSPSNFILVNFGTVEELEGKTFVMSTTNTAAGSYGFLYADADGTNRLGSSPRNPITVSSEVAEGRTNVVLKFFADIADSSAVFTYNDVQVEEGSTATDYAPYYNGGTATAEMLLKVGDYTDVQEVITGAVTRKVGIKVFDGTENIVYDYGVYGIIGIPYNHNAMVVGTSFYKGFCSHAKTYINNGVPTADRTFDKFLFFTNIDFVGFGSYEAPAEITDVASVKQWLAAQYAAGTPVIIVYPLATETTESVAGQTLNVTSGDNVIDIAQASLSNLELEAQYRKRL